MKIIQPMLNAIRNNDFAAMYKYEDIMINLDELMMNHKRDTQYEGRVKAAMKEKQLSNEYKRKDVTENLIIEISSIGIFTSLTQKELSKVIRQIVELSSVESDFATLKRQAIEKLI